MAKTTTVPAPDIVSKFYNNLDLETREILPEKKSLVKEANQIQKGLRDPMPRHPTSIEELEIPEHFQNLAEDGIFYDSKWDDGDDGNRILFFSTESNMDQLFNSTQVGMDGTFKVPGMFRQLVDIFGKVNGRFLPLAYAFMEKKTKAGYIKILQKIQQLRVIIFSSFFLFFSFQVQVLSQMNFINL